MFWYLYSIKLIVMIKILPNSKSDGDYLTVVNDLKIQKGIYSNILLFIYSNIFLFIY